MRDLEALQMVQRLDALLLAALEALRHVKIMASFSDRAYDRGRKGP